MLPSMGRYRDQAGWVHISWSVVQANGDSQFSFRWQERGGPLVEPPTIKGFGAVVLEQVMAEYFAVPPKIEFASSGVWYELKGPLQAVTTLTPKREVLSAHRPVSTEHKSRLRVQVPCLKP